MDKNQGSDPIDERVPTVDDIAEDERVFEALMPSVRNELTDDEEI
jgi:hypothetical protein